MQFWHIRHTMISRISGAIAVLALGLLAQVGPATAQGLPGSKLIDAILDNNLAIARHEVLNGSSVNQRDGDGVPAIVLAAQHNRYYLIDFLLQNRANVNATTKETGETAMIAAADEGNIDIVEQLIDAGADFNQEDDRGETAMIKAVRKGHLRIVRTLADAGADLNHTDYTGRSALAHAEESRQRGIMRFLESRNATY
ncbi:MAG: ankyrin repeat domain-containing protein [Alphaproteobacteria bacterium]